MEIICQVGIVVLGSISIWLLARKDKWQRWGYIVGIVSEPFWLGTALINNQPGIILLTIWYTYAFGLGIWNHWLKK